MTKPLILSAIALAMTSFSAGARAADLTPASAPPPIYNWTGVYLGLNGGGAWGSQNPYEAITNRFDNDTISFGGGLLGGTAGAQIQVAHVVMGVESDLAWASLQGSATRAPHILGAPVGFELNATTKINWDLTFRARVGYAIDNWLPFIAAGAAVLGSQTHLSSARGFDCDTLQDIGGRLGELSCSGSRTRLGATVGAGVEYGFNQNWSAKLEYRYTAAASFELSHINEVRAGVNYRFGGP